MEDDLSRFSCQNAACADYGKQGLGNLTVCGRYGKERQHRLLYCRTCKARFSERKGTPLFGSQLPPEKAAALLQHLAQHDGIRATARSVGVAPNTVVRYNRLIANPPAKDDSRLIPNPPATDDDGSSTASNH